MMENYAVIEYLHIENSDWSEEALLKINTDNLQCYCDSPDFKALNLTQIPAELTNGTVIQEDI